MQGDVIRMMVLVTGVFEKMGVPYAVGGSMSSSVNGIMRTTMDIDIVADLQLEQVEDFIAALSSAFYSDEGMIRDAVVQHGSFNLIHLDTAYKVDVFIPKPRLFDRMQLQRSRIALIGTNPDIGINVTSPEDIILSKLEWYRMGGEVSDRQWRDIMGVIRTQGDRLDLDYLRRLSKTLNIDDLLERLLRDFN